MKIGYDIDGVFADFPRAFAKLVKEQTGKVIPPVPTKFNWHRDVVTPEEEAKLWHTVQTTDFMLHVPRYQWALALADQANAWRKRGHHVYFITSRHGVHARRLAEDWLFTRVFVDMPSVIQSAEKGMVANALELDIFIDDQLQYCQQVANACPMCDVIQVAHAWNVHDVRGRILYLPGHMLISQLDTHVVDVA